MKAILELCDKINSNIIEVYNTYKDFDFYRAFAHNKKYFDFSDGLLSDYNGSGEKNNNLKEISMEGSVLQYRLLYANDCTVKSAVDYFNRTGWDLSSNYILAFKIFKNKDKYAEHVRVARHHFFNIKDFFNFCAENYKSEGAVRKNLEILANMPNDVIIAHAEYYKEKNKKENDFLNTINSSLSEINKVLNQYQKPSDYMELYRTNPDFFLEKITEMTDEQAGPIVKELVKLPIKEGQLKVDKYVSERFPDIIAPVGRRAEQ